MDGGRAIIVSFERERERERERVVIAFDELAGHQIVKKYNQSADHPPSVCLMTG